MDQVAPKRQSTWLWAAWNRLRGALFRVQRGSITHSISYKMSTRACLGVNGAEYRASGGLVAQAVSRSPPTAGVPSSRLGPSMWVSWWTKRGLGRFSMGFLPFSPTTNIIPPFLHTHLIHFVSFHPPL